MNRLITSASTNGPKDGLIRDDLPQFAFTGRSNVGKSSLLNALMRERLARTSAAAGKTRQANVYLTTMQGGLGHPGAWSAYLVDLPGYGYARGGRESVDELATVVEAYFASGLRRNPGARERRGMVFLLVDSRHPGLPLDLGAYKWLCENVEAPMVLATKIDKLSRGERRQNLAAFEKIFGQMPLGVSSNSGEGLNDLRRIMARAAG